jgi:hypothetical protein
MRFLPFIWLQDQNLEPVALMETVTGAPLSCSGAGRLGFIVPLSFCDSNETANLRALFAPNGRWTIRELVDLEVIYKQVFDADVLPVCQVHNSHCKGVVVTARRLSVAIYGAFFVTVFARPVFGGTLYDENGYLPFKPPIGPQHWRWDVNVTAFTILSTITLAGIVAALEA